MLEMENQKQYRFRYNKDLICSAYWYYYSHISKVKWFLVGWSLLVAACPYLGTHDLYLSAIWFLASFIALTIVIYGAGTIRLHQQLRMWNKIFPSDTEMSFSDTGIFSKHALAESKIDWKVFERFFETDKFFLLLMGRQYVIVPKCAFGTSENEATFKKTLTAYVKAG